ncbi:MAG TPA: MlaD family protein [Paralcaligenes sp.]
MTDQNTAPEPEDQTEPLAKPVVKPRRETRISWIWLVPLIAAAVGLSLVVKTWLHTGPDVTISFESAEGIEPGQTKVRYRDVVVGVVTGIHVSSDRKKALVRAELDRDDAEFLTQEGARYWVVRPRLGATGVSGLGTLLSGVYIGVDAPESKEPGKSAYSFVGLEKPPEVASGRPGTRFTLNAPDLGSLEIGSPVYYRRIQVGRVVGYDLNPNGSSVDIQIFIDAPNDQFVTSDARFWNSSGINFSLNADGLTVQTGSLAAVMAGGISFISVHDGNTTPAPRDTVFPLSRTQAQALADPDGPPFPIELRFRQSVRGLKVGAPVDFRGLELGKVIDIDLEFDTKANQFYALVKAELYPMRFGTVYEGLLKGAHNEVYPGQAVLAPLVKQGLRAQIRASNLLTGQQYVALDFFPDAEPVEFQKNKVPLELPTVAGSFDQLQQQIGRIVTKLDKIPFDGISKDLRASLVSVTKLLDGLNSRVAPQATATLKAAQQSLHRVDKLLAQDSPLSDNLDGTMRELTGAAKALRALADYLRATPSALVRGRAADVLPASP